jgi:hypothetical protein
MPCFSRGLVVFGGRCAALDGQTQKGCHTVAIRIMSKTFFIDKIGNN